MSTIHWLRYATLLALLTNAIGTCPPDYTDTGQSQNKGLLTLTGSVGSRPAESDIEDGVMSYCSSQPNAVCIIMCTLTLPTIIHSPSYSINGGCFSAGGNGDDLQGIGVNSTHNHPVYTIHFPCHAISTYRCVLNVTLYTQEVRVQQDTAACGTRPPTTNSTPPVSSDGGNATNDTTAIVPDPAAYDTFAVIRAGIIVAVVLVVAIAGILSIISVIMVVHRDRLRSQGSIICRMMRSCYSNDHVDEGNCDLEAQIGIPADDRGGEEERVVGHPLPVEGGGGGQQRRNSVQRQV